MKSRNLLFFLTILFSVQTSFASHFAGGEIGWRCIPNGKHIFYMKIYRDCRGIPFTYGDETLEVYGNPLPRDQNNQIIKTIRLKPERNFFTNNSNGDTSPAECGLSCGAGDPGILQQFWWVSDPITLQGTPTANGWTFVHTPSCCRSTTMTNVVAGGNAILRAVMYPDANRSNVNSCIDSSPEFAALPISLICRGIEFSYNHTAFDPDLDSLAYDFDRPLNVGLIPHGYKAGYSPQSPMPSVAMNPNNIPASIDRMSGKIDFKVVSGNGTERFLQVVRVDAIRQGRVIASVFREMPFTVFSCTPTLGGNGPINIPPLIIMDGDTTESKTIDVIAGRRIEVPIRAIDRDSSLASPPLQQVYMEPNGYMFAKDFMDPGFCNYTPPPGAASSCATLSNQRPVFQPNLTPVRYRMSDSAGIATLFAWETKCHHVASSNTGIPGYSASLYNFVMRTYDDHCDIAGTTYPTLTIRVRDPFPLEQPIMKGASVDLQGKITLLWVPPIDTVPTFFAYNVERAATPIGALPTIFTDLNPVNPYLKKYKQSEKIAMPIFQPLIGAPVGAYDILNKNPFDYYFRMRSVSGCTEDVESDPSDPIKVMDLTASPNDIAPNPPNSRVRLNWTSPTTVQNPHTYPYFRYESQTKYYVWTNRNLSGPVDTIGLKNPTNWELSDSTTNLGLQWRSGTCSGTVAFRVEARDTVISWAQGNNGVFPKDTLDTLTFSTFSIIDTIVMNYATLEIITNELLYLRLDGTVDSLNWINCSNDSLVGQGSRFFPNQAGNYKVVYNSSCKLDTTDCFQVNSITNTLSILSHKELESDEREAYYQWIDCNTNLPIPGETNRNFVALDTGIYAVVVSAYGMKDTSACVPLFPVSIKEPKVNFSDLLNLFPNPTQGKLILERKNFKGRLNLKQLNIAGQLIQDVALADELETQITLKGEQGIYFIQITNEQGETATFKVIKQ